MRINSYVDKLCFQIRHNQLAYGLASRLHYKRNMSLINQHTIFELQLHLEFIFRS